MYRAALAGEYVDADEEPGALENTGKATAHGPAPTARPTAAARPAVARGAHRQLGPDDDFVYVPCLNKSRAHLKVLVSVLSPYVGEAG